jgi:hypothetical protein
MSDQAAITSHGADIGCPKQNKVDGGRGTVYHHKVKHGAASSKGTLLLEVERY